MAGGANKAFTGNFRDFLRNNVLIVSLGGQNDLQDRYRAGVALVVDLVKSSSMSGVSASGKKIPVYEVLRAQGLASAHSHRFRAYYLPYRNNDIRTMRLDPASHGNADAAFFFTDSLNGCSFAAGPGQYPKVGHFNRTEDGEDGKPIDQGAINADITQEFPGGTTSRIEKTHYKNDAADYATVMGVKTGADWTFWVQSRSVTGMTTPKRDRKGVALGAAGYVWTLAQGTPTQLGNP